MWQALLKPWTGSYLNPYSWGRLWTLFISQWTAAEWATVAVSAASISVGLWVVTLCPSILKVVLLCQFFLSYRAPIVFRLRFVCPLAPLQWSRSALSVQLDFFSNVTINSKPLTRWSDYHKVPELVGFKCQFPHKFIEINEVCYCKLYKDISSQNRDGVVSQIIHSYSLLW